MAVKGLLPVLRRLWIPLALLVLFCLAGLTVSRLHGVFGADELPSYAEAIGAETTPGDPKHLTYEVFGVPGAAADISFFDMNGDPQLVHARLPWFYGFTATAVPIGSVVAQGDDGTIGCRIVVDGTIKTEKIMDEPSAFTFCLLKAS